MKLLILLILIGNPGFELPGEYSNDLNQKLSLKLDSTFEFEWKFSATSGWSQGAWEMNGDTLILTAIPIMDTIKNTDSLVLSIDKVANYIDYKEYQKYENSYPRQTPEQEPKKFLCRKDKLIPLFLNQPVKKLKVAGKMTSNLFIKN